MNTILRPTIGSIIIGSCRILAKDDRGATAIEYALIASGVGVAIAATVYNLGSSLNGLYASVAALF
jgi:pilus assembly protein Flp/PilA